jgi:LacI family transcriptional regulator
MVETSLASGRGILAGIARYVREVGSWAIYHEPCDVGAAPPRWLKTWRGDGIIARVQNRRIASAVAASGLPAVDVLGVVQDTDLPLVHVDDVAIARLAAEHFIERGIRQFGCLAVRGINWSHRRRDTFVRTVSVMGCSCNVYHLGARSQSDASWEQQQDHLGRWIANLAKPAGVLAVSDPQGRRVLEACRRVGVLVPEELAVIGVDNDETVCELADPPLSSVIADHARMGYEAARVLDRMMHGRAPRQTVLTQPSGVAMRCSTDMLAVDDEDVVSALRFIRQNACRGIDVDEVVRYVPTSRTSLKRRFRTVLGRSIHDEIIAARVKRVEQLLSQSYMSLAEIARRTGFPSQSYMGVVFKANTGKSPGKYRASMQR